MTRYTVERRRNGMWSVWDTLHSRFASASQYQRSLGAEAAARKLNKEEDREQEKQTQTTSKGK